VETIGSKRSYALIWCMPNNDDDDVKIVIVCVMNDHNDRSFRNDNYCLTKCCD